MRKRISKLICMLLIFTLCLSSSLMSVSTEAVAKSKTKSTKVTMTVGAQKKLSVKTSKTVKWSTSKKKVATISKKGLLKAKAIGTATITAKYGKTKKLFKITVNKAVVDDVHGASLKDLYSKYFMMGAAINGTSPETAAIKHSGMAAVLKKHYNSTTLSNLMKPVNLLDEQASKSSADGMPVVTFAKAKESLDFCKENNIKMRGHTLVWHNQTPSWFFKENYDDSKPYVSKEVMEKRMESYIKQALEYVQTNYPGVVYCWDVVNEAVSDSSYDADNSDGWACRTTFYGDDNYWYKTMGTDYVEKAFTYARKYAAPDVKLMYNDYNVFIPSKRDSIYTLVSKLKAKNLIDGIGLQPTVTLTYPSQLKGSNGDSFETCLRKYAQLGVDIQITELGFKVEESATKKTRTAADLKLQAARYKEMMELLVKMDTASGGPCNITSVTVFGICDDYPLYKNNIQCLYLWDTKCKPKQAFYSVREIGEKYNHK